MFNYNLPIPRDQNGNPTGFVCRLPDGQYVPITDPDFVAFNAAQATPDDLKPHPPAPPSPDDIAKQEADAAVQAFIPDSKQDLMTRLAAVEGWIQNFQKTGKA